MEKIKIIIEDIKKFFNETKPDDEKILNYIQNKYSLEIEKNGFNKKDLIFLIDLTINNLDLSSDILKDIFLNSKNKIQQKILISAIDTTSIINPVLDSNKLDEQVLNIMSNIGSIFIKPEKIYLLWNNKITNAHLRDNDKLDEKTNIEVKLINYTIFLEQNDSVNNGNSVLSNITDNFIRNFGFPKKQGFNTRYQLLLVIDNDITLTSIHDFCLGDCHFYLNEYNFPFKLKTNSDIYGLIGKAKDILISFFSKNNIKIINFLKLFFSNQKLYPYISIIFESLKKEKILIPKKEIKKFTFVENIPNEPLLNAMFMTEPCEHVEEYKKVYTSGNYFVKVNEFINNYINYEDGRALCVLCNESIKELNIQAAFFIDKERFITTPDNILLYPPYNKFNNLKFFMDNLFYIFMFNTKMGIYNSVLVTRILVDNLILVSSNRIELEIKYRQDIIDENIFLLRLTNNFFENYDLEKEKYKEKRTFFTNLPAYIIIFVTSSLSDYYDFFFIKKRIKLNKINMVWANISFEDVMAYICDLIFKNSDIEQNYMNLTEKLRIKKIKRSIQIYYEIFNDEFRILYKEKKIIFENYLKRLSERDHMYKIEKIGNFMDGIFATEFNTLGQYLLNVNKIDMLKHENELKYYKNTNIILEDINKNVNIETENIKNFNIEKTFFDKKNNILNLDLFEIDKREYTKNELEDLDLVYSEFLKEKHYLYNQHKYTILKIYDFFILDSEKQKIQFQDTDLLDIKSLNTYTNKDLVEGDVFLYLSELKLFHFEYILRQFFNYIHKKYGIIINSNITKFLKNAFHTRKELFLLKIKILNLIFKLNILQK